MSDYTKFLIVKHQLQKFYNFKAKEEREIIYATKIIENSSANTSETNYFNGRISTMPDNSNERSIPLIAINNLIAITHLKNTFYIEFLKLDKDISFKFSSNLEMLLKLTVITNDEISFRMGDKDFITKFYNELNLKEFVWSIIKIITKKKLEGQVQIKGINYKDLEDFADKNNFHVLNKIFEEEKKKERYEVEVTDRELEDLEYTLKSLNIDSIVSYDLENLNSKIEQFNISTKDSFLKRLQGKFTEDVNNFLKEIEKLDNNTTDQIKSLDLDIMSIADIWHGIQKIEDANHRIELRHENKRKTHEYMKKLLEQLTISKSKEENLTNCRYLSNSELVIVNEIMDNFVKFYKSRKKQDTKLAIIKEGHEKIKIIIELMISNFNSNIYDYIRTHNFKETYLLKYLPNFNNTKLIKSFNETTEKLKNNRSYLENFIIDRKFFIEKLNILVNNQEDLNKTKIFKDCVTIIAKGMRDTLAVEFNSGIQMLQLFFDCEILDPDKLDIYLSSDNLLKYNAFEKINSDYVYEVNKYFSTFILNCFFAADKCVEILTNFFNEQPNFYLEKSSKFNEEVEKLVTQKIYDYLSKNFNTSVEKNILLGFVIFTILCAVQERISKNIIDDMIVLSIKDIFEDSYKIDYSYTSTLTDNQHEYRRVDVEEVGIRKISLQETKNFIAKNLKTLHSLINVFLSEQIQILTEYNVEVRRVGVIPIIEKTLNFVKIPLALTKGIKQDCVFEIVEDFRNKIRSTIERLAKVNPKYTNIIFIENYYFICMFYRSLEKYDIHHADVLKYEGDAWNIYQKFKEDYIKEIFEYQFKEFSTYFDKFNIQYNTLGDQVRMQSSFTFQAFDKIVINFMKDLSKNVEKMAKRVNKHFCKNLGLGPIIWIDVQIFLNKILSSLDIIYKNCYNKEVDSKWITAANDSIKNFVFSSLKK